MVVYLDMDGVLVDLVSGLWGIHGGSYPYIDPANAGIYSLESLWGISTEEMWTDCDEDWWATLPPHREAKFIVSKLVARFGEKNIFILTCPVFNDGLLDWDVAIKQYRECVAGKIRWLARHFPHFRKRMIPIVTSKGALAHKEALLVDDCDRHVNEFRAAGGKALLVPRPWNSVHLAECRIRPMFEDWLEIARGMGDVRSDG